MSMVKVAAVAAVIGLGYVTWHSHQAHVKAAALARITDNYGFIEKTPPIDTPRDKVLVIAAQNCPHDDAVRADRLFQQLSENDIPAVRLSSVTFSYNPEDQAQVDSLNLTGFVMDGPLPVVFVNGRAKDNPDLDEVIAEYRAMAGR